jgi:hypothetical protein
MAYPFTGSDSAKATPFGLRTHCLPKPSEMPQTVGFEVRNARQFCLPRTPPVLLRFRHRERKFRIRMRLAAPPPSRLPGDPARKARFRGIARDNFIGKVSPHLFSARTHI